jgi:four helix bundle protein
VKSFTELLVWQKAHQLFIDTLDDINKFPQATSSKIIAGQVIRSIGSISANFSEGFNASTTKE